MAEKTDEEIIKEVGLENSNDITPEEALEELSLDNNSEESLEPIIEGISTTNESSNNEELKSKKNDSEDNNTKNNDNTEKENVEENISLQKKQPKIYKILMGVVGFLLLVLIIGISLYFLGFFDPEEPEKMPDKKVEIKKEATEIEFDTKDLNKKRLNKKLTMLTKHEIMNRTELEAEEKKIKEEKRKKKESEEKAIADKKRIAEEKLAIQYAKIEKEKQILEDQQKAIKERQEDFLKLQEEAAMRLEEKRIELLKELEEQRNMAKIEPEIEIEQIVEEPKEEIIVEETEEIMEKKTSNTFSSFINVATIKGELYKEFLDGVQKYDKSISLCRDDKNRIEILFGPYDSNKERQKVYDNLINNGFKESYLIDFTNEEYKKRCKY